MRLLVYLKRFLVINLKLFGFLFQQINDLYKNSIGFKIYKIYFYLSKRLQRYFPKSRFHRYEIFGQRWVLQLMFLVVVFFLMYPQTKLYSKETESVAGRQTLLYKMVGPGDQDFSLDDYSSIELNVVNVNSGYWHEGAIKDTGYNQGANLLTEDYNTLSLNGQALVKRDFAPNLTENDGTANTALTIQKTSEKNRKQTTYYIVKAGDVLGKIAEKFNLKIETILWANNLTARSFIRPGQKLKIPPADGVSYIVRRGDTVLSIARRYQTDAEKVINFNNLSNNGANIKIGQELFLPDGQPIRQVVNRPVYKQSQTNNNYSSNKPSTANVGQYHTTRQWINGRRVNVLDSNYSVFSDNAPPPSVNKNSSTGYIWPTAAKVITQYYGWRHLGLDIAGPVGTPLYASRSGTVLSSECNYKIGYGCYILLDHGNGVQTLYAHASKLYVRAGDYVSQGQTIAAMGSTGWSTGPHVHFEVRVSGRRVNPLTYVRR